ncbi:heavy metal-associated isoprenylated plant protein 16-like [Lycium barbarum]|uniref:heavy metal-associated isoprenylated plant protein 16-like n=1 Tax=Lycium barbarum TaxID=112863 RepID=UPI00293EAD6C|nr:heavy metal-associated isoprenylated plant protein 16-like [Lycium barbarum]
MKQKVIIKLFMDRNDQRCRTKAFKIAVSQPGVESAAIQGGENYQLEIVGEHVDPVVLTNCLRKKVGQAELVSVVSVVAAGSGANPEASKPVRPQPQPYSYPDFGVPQYQVYEVRDPNPACCSIM